MNPASDPFRSFFRMKRPCANCPFLKDGAIELMAGRVDGIIRDLKKNDKQSFLCHKTLNSDGADDFEDDCEDEGETQVTRPIFEGEKMCAGAAAYLLKIGRPTIGMRYAMITGSVAHDHWADAEGVTIDPED